MNDPNADRGPQDTQSETSVALGANGTVIVAFNDSGSNGGGLPLITGTARSKDGGSIFVDQGALPRSAYGDGGDPVVDRDKTKGTVYLATLAATVSNRVQLFRSFDDGASYSTPVNAAPLSSASILDKPWISVDNYAGAGQGNVYLVVRDFAAGHNGIYLTRSTNGGITWGPTGGGLIASAGTGNVQGAWVTVGKDHAVHVYWYDQTASTPRILMRSSSNRGSRSARRSS